MELECFDVVVVGCGPVGAVAGNLLGQAGLKTLVIDQERAPYDLPRAIHIDHEVMRIFQSAGMAEKILPLLSVPTGSMHFGADRGVIRQLHKIVVADDLGWASDYFFYQPELEAVLRSELALRANVRLELGTALVGLRPLDDGVELECACDDGRRFGVRARYVIGCDGARSQVRRQLGVELEDLGFEESWVVVDALVDGPISFPQLHGVPPDVDLQDIMIMLGDPSRPISVIPGSGRHRRWEFMLLPSDTPALAASREFLDEILTPWTKGARCEVLRSAVYRFHGLIAERWRDGAVFLAGDAAHQTPPFFGQGLCHGIRDVANLCWKLRLVKDGLAGDDLLDTYELERKPQVRAVIEASIRTGRYICTLDRAAAAQRDIAMRAVATQTKPAYFDIVPPLEAGVLAPGAREGVGRRFIQPRVRGADGRSGLLDDMTGGGFVLLARDKAPILTEAAASAWRRLGGETFVVRRKDADRIPLEPKEVLDETGELAKWLEQVDARLVLLRPDAYVFGVASNDGEAVSLLLSLADAALAKAPAASVV